MGLIIKSGRTSDSVEFYDSCDNRLYLDVQYLNITAYPNSMITANMTVSVDRIELANGNCQFFMMDPISQTQRKVKLVRFEDGAYIDFDGMVTLSEEQARKLK